MADFVANFSLENNDVDANFDLESTQFDAILELNPTGTSWGSITGTLSNQEDLQEALNDKANASAVEIIAENVDTISNTINSYGDIVTYDASAFATSEQGELADTALQPGDNISELVNDAEYATTSELSEGLSEKQDTISDLDTIRNDAQNGASAYSIIQSYGDIVTYDADNFATSAQGSLADTALQPNDSISELNNDAGYITSSAIPTNYVTTDTTQSVTGTKNFTQINNVNSNNLAAYNSIQLTNDIGNTSENLRLQGNGDRPKYRSGSNVTSYLALQTDIQTYTAGNGIDITSNAISVTTPVIIDNATGSHSIALGSSSQSTAEGSVAIGDTAKANSTYSTAIGYNAQATNTNSVVIGKQAKATAARTIAIGSGAEANANDALVIKGINNTANSFQVGSYTLLDTSTGLIPDARINSSTYATQSYVNNAVQTNSAHFRGNWTDWATVPTDPNDYPADDDGNKTPTVNDYMVVQDASDYTLDTLEGTWQFTYTGTWADNGKAGWLPRFQVNETPLTQIQLDALNSGANTTNIGQIATNTNDISNINTTIGGYGDIVAYNASSFATAAQGTKADSALQSGDNVSELVNNAGYITGINSSDVTTALGYTPYDSSNPSGYTSNIGTVTSVNSTLPDGSGNVTISIPTVLDYYGTCDTAAATQAKEVTCSGFTLDTGKSIRVKFSKDQTFNGAPTLNVNSTGAYTVQSKSGTDAVRYCWRSGEVVAFTFDGSYWIMEDSALATETYYGITKLNTSATMSSTASAITPSSLNQLVQNMIEPYSVYSASSTYSVGDRVRYDFNAWECNTAITTAEAWDATHWTKIDDVQTQIETKQATLVSGTNIKTVNGNSLLGSGDITISGSSTDVQINGTSITSGGVANIITNSAYNASSNKIATMSDIPAVGANTDLSNLSATGETHFQAPLVSGTNIKTINSINILGPGNFTLADTNLSNLSSTGKKVIDSAITINQQYITVGTAAVTDKTIDIASYLPSDSYTYLVFVRLYGNNNSTRSGITLKTDLVELANLISPGSSGRYDSNSCWVPVGSGRTMKITIGAAMTTMQFELVGYRRVGTNT